MRRSAVELPTQAGVVFLQGDARDIAEIPGVPRDLGQVVCAVAPDERSEAAYRAAYPEVVAALLKSFPGARIILVSSTAVYGQTHGEIVDENAPACPAQPTAQQLRHAEDLLLSGGGTHAATSAHQAGHVVVRASGIYGPGRTKLITSLLNHDLPEALQHAFSSRIHRDDLVGILEFLLSHPELSGVFNASDPQPATMGEMARWIRHELPQGGMGGSFITREHKDRKILPARLLKLGYAFKYPSFVEGYRQILEAEGVLAQAGAPDSKR
jgi:nucleoside-diphosphate-sugar epimerase